MAIFGGPSDLVCDGLALVIQEVSDHDLRPQLTEQARLRRALAPRTAADQGDPPIQIDHRLVSSAAWPLAQVYDLG